MVHCWALLHLCFVLLQPALDVQVRSTTHQQLDQQLHPAYGKGHDLQVVPSHQTLDHFHPHLDWDMELNSSKGS